MASVIAAVSTRNRTQQSAQPRFTTSRAGDAVINMTALVSEPAGATQKKRSALFGPNIGVVSAGPKWTEGNQRKVVNDQLTADIVNSWIAKSSKPHQPTTTLQALVNLKRPTLRLSPLSPAVSDEPDSSHPEIQNLHGLEFEFDCDAPKCGIYVYALLKPDHPEADQSSVSAGLSKSLVFDAVVDGGFGRFLKFEDGAALDLDKFESKPDPISPPSDHPALPPLIHNAGDAPSAESRPATAVEEGRRKRRFSAFHFRKRMHGRAIAGPALAVVDAQPVATAVAGSSPVVDKAKDAPDGVKVIIRLAALDEDGSELGGVNEQMTYLHVIRFGPKRDGEEAGEDHRPWVVNVVKREATIGLHTFHLHEIYGLSSNSASTPTPTAPLPSPTTHSYPPSSPGLAPPMMDCSASECLVCLSNPREVVLLPCRHLVACKDCALNMVEFGAGGSIIQHENEPTLPVAEEATPAAPGAGTDTDPSQPTAEAAAEDVSTPPAATPTPVATPAAPAAPRRKRRAKGWFCPVCRQPYTSLLRLTTTPPEKEEFEAEAEAEAPPVSEPKSESVAEPATPRIGGIPGFLRSFSSRSGANLTASANANVDVERNASGS